MKPQDLRVPVEVKVNGRPRWRFRLKLGSYRVRHKPQALGEMFYLDVRIQDRRARLAAKVLGAALRALEFFGRLLRKRFEVEVVVGW